MSFALPILRKIDFKDAPTWIRWSRNGTKILHGYLRAQAVYIRAAGTGERIARLHCRETPRFGDWSFDDKYISVVEDGRVTIRDGKTGEILQEARSKNSSQQKSSGRSNGCRRLRETTGREHAADDIATAVNSSTSV